jgi:hypothetical protein
MKHLFIMLLIACSALTTANAQQKNKPENVIKAFEFLIGLYGQKAGQTYSVEKNPNTGIIESSERIVPFTCKKDEPYITMMGEDFMKDEPLSYQIKHITPGQGSQNFTLAVHTNVPNVINHYAIRTKSAEEMWFMACKNPDNPSLRDAYAIVWQPAPDNKVKGTIYMITSPRPSNFDRVFDNSKKVFKIEGRVDANIKDSLYNIYIANSYDALNAVGDDDYVACVPVINKRFEYQTELDRPMVGRLRCIFPDGELCSAWIDLDFVPGETYHITVHNGYYDDDEDYERRVGRYSGKSLINSEVVVDTVAVIDDFEAEAPVVSEYATPQPKRNNNLKQQPTPLQKMQIEAKGKAFEAKMEAIKASYAALKPFIDLKTLAGTDGYFAQITKQNKELDADFHELIKWLEGLVPDVQKPDFLGTGYKELLKFYTEQNQGFTELIKACGVLPKTAQKTQKELNKLIEKNMAELSNIIAGGK